MIARMEAKTEDGKQLEQAMELGKMIKRQQEQRTRKTLFVDLK